MTENPSYNRGCRLFAQVSLFMCCLLCCILLMIVSAECAPNRLQWIRQIQIGSRLADVLQIVDPKDIDYSLVTQWLPSTKAAYQKKTNKAWAKEGVMSTEYGYFRKKPLGDFRQWKPSESLAKTFTGDISIDIYQFMDDSTLLKITFVNGVVVEKFWRH